MTIDQMQERKVQRRYTFQMLSEHSGVPVPTLQKIFSGETKLPRRQTLLAIERAFEELERETARSLYGGIREQDQEILRDAGKAYCAARLGPERKGSSGEGNNGGACTEGLRGEGSPNSGFLWPRQGSYTVEDYLALPDEQRVELIDGVFYNMSAPGVVHQWIAGEVYRQIANYIFEKRGDCRPFIAPVDVQLDDDESTMVQPDVIILCDPDKISPERIHGAPDFILEVISPSTKRKDYVLKLRKYESAGVREYWILDPRQEIVLTYYFEQEDMPVIRGLGEPIPVGIYGGDLMIEFSHIRQWIRES